MPFARHFRLRSILPPLKVVRRVAHMGRSVI